MDIFKLLKKKKITSILAVVRKILIMTLAFVILSSNVIFLKAKALGQSSVMIWTTNLHPTVDPNDGWSQYYYAVEPYFEGMKEFYEQQGATVSTIDSGHLSSNSLSGVNLLWVVIPTEDFNQNDINYMSDFIATGGRIVFCGENNAWVPQINGYLSTAISKLGGNFSILGTDHSPDTVAVSGSKIVSSNLTTNLTGFYYDAAANISYSGSTQVVVYGPENPPAPLIVDQAVGNGRIMLMTDINTWDPIVKKNANLSEYQASLEDSSKWGTSYWDTYFTTTYPCNNEELFKNLLTDSQANQDIVAGGGNPNVGFGGTPSYTIVANAATFNPASTQSYTFTVEYKVGSGSSATFANSQFDDNDVTVKNSSGTPYTVHKDTMVGGGTGIVSGAGTGDVVVKYKVNAPDTTWDNPDNDTYTIGIVNAAVQDSDGKQIVGVNNAATFTVSVGQPSPAVTGISPSSGSTAGGTTVTITGTNFTGATAVKFGSADAVYTVNSDTQITATAPAGSSGVADITVVTAGGTSATSSADQFTYMETVAAPTASIAGGAVASGTTVTLSSGTDGATIYYTTDGSTPTASSTQYTGAITVTSGMTIKAIAVKSGMTDSGVMSESYTIISTYTVTFKDYNGTVLKTQSVNEGGSATAPTAPTRAGYAFAGWDKIFTNITENITVMATYTPTVVILTSDSLGAAGNSKVTGLKTGTKYKVAVGGTTKYVKADATLSDSESDVGALSGTEITGLTNGTTYNVQEYTPAPIAPSITTQPLSETKTEGETASFSVIATGDAPLNYQWKKDGADLVGKTSSTLTLNNVQKSDEGSYKVVVTNSAGSITSDEAILTVTTSAAVTYNLNYEAGKGGKIEGDSSQTVAEGNNGTKVTAVADKDYHFVEWSDGKTDASRKDTNVTEDIDVSAEFELDLPSSTNTTPAGVTIIGTQQADNTLEAQFLDEDGVSVTTSAAVTYKWYRIPSSDSENGTLVGEGKTYKLVSDDIGKYIKLVATYIDETFKKITSKISKNSSSNSTSSSSHSSSGSSSTASSTSSTQQITVKVTDGSSDNSISQTVINRTTASDGTKKDTVTYTADKAKETVAALTSEGKDTARIVATDTDINVSETQVNIPKETLSALSSGNVNLQIETGGAIVSLPKDSVQGLVQSGQLNGDLYFRLVPIKDETKQTEIKTTADQQATIKAISGNSGVQVLGTPMTIETNMSQRAVDIVLPLKGITIPTDATERQAFLNDLGVFIEHSDGEKVLEKGQVVEYAAGVFGIKFTVNKFSDFTIVKLNQKIQTGWKQINGYWYFFNNTGTMTTGWYKSESGDWTYNGQDTVGQWFHLGTDGKMDIGWFKDTDGSWYFLCDGKDYGALGYMETGWKFTDGKWYFLKGNGAMATGWTYVDGNWYYLYSDGSMASNTVIDGCKLNASGAWIK